ncbi:hypothetical protein KBC04_00945 [Candidatus Babeliales bacterium]|nr:hypothetical protein [Candidatus Babeliales bacterium]MBP9843698.1 hypothetical protein [Candidatus Babeliales bacterium]
MKYKYLLYCVTLLFCTQPIASKVSNDRIKAWLELGALRQKVDNNIKKYTNLQAELKQETNAILQQGIDEADELAQDDPYAALVMYYDLKKLQDSAVTTSLDIDAINEKFQALSDYVTKTIKELEAIRRKHLQFP